MRMETVGSIVVMLVLISTAGSFPLGFQLGNMMGTIQNMVSNTMRQGYGAMQDTMSSLLTPGVGVMPAPWQGYTPTWSSTWMAGLPPATTWSWATTYTPADGAYIVHRQTVGYPQHTTPGEQLLRMGATCGGQPLSATDWCNYCVCLGSSWTCTENICPPSYMTTTNNFFQ